MKSSVFWNIKPCSPLKINRRFGGTYRLHIQCLRIRKAEFVTCFNAGFVLGLFFDTEDGGDLFLRKKPLSLNRSVLRIRLCMTLKLIRR
jgi:hypothetical protein